MYRLAVMSGEINVDRLSRSITAKQFAAWEHFAQLEPFGEIRADWRAASIREMVFNMAVANKDRKPMKDFLLKFEDDEVKPTEQTWQEKQKIAYAIAAAFNAPGVNS